MLIYPVLDQRMETLSMKEFTDTPIWNSKLNQKMWKFLLGNQKIVSPSEEKDVSFFPPTYLETADYDCLHDEGALFAQRLEEMVFQLSIMLPRVLYMDTMQYIKVKLLKTPFV